MAGSSRIYYEMLAAAGWILPRWVKAPVPGRSAAGHCKAASSLRLVHHGIMLFPL